MKKKKEFDKLVARGIPPVAALLVLRYHRLRATLQEILDEATGDRDWDIVITACQGALKEEGTEEKETDWSFLTPIGRREDL